jgi:hypothetical protein
MIVRFRPANISLINRRHYLPRLLLTLFSKGQMQKPHQRFEDVDRVTPYQVRVADDTARILPKQWQNQISSHVQFTGLYVAGIGAFAHRTSGPSRKIGK